MRAPWVIAGVVLVAGCGGGGDAPSDPVTPPSPPAKTASSIAIHAGDAQTAEPGSALGVRPAVVVRDAAGQPVGGVVVTFSIDAGGGSVTTPTATSNASGIAEAGDWRLGIAAGENALRASTGALSPVTFHAQGRFPSVRTLLDNRPIAPTGGTLSYTRAGDPLSGIAIEVPNGAYPAATTWTVTADSTIPVPLPPDFSLASPVYSIGNGQGYADSLMAITLPIRAAPDEVVAPFFFDQATGHLEGIDLIARSDTSATLATYHVAADLMAIPGRVPAAFRRNARVASPAVAFGGVKMVFVKLAQTKLVGTFGSNFQPGVDDWEFPNYGDYQGPNGNCWGMTAMAMYYHYVLRPNGAPPLFGMNDVNPLNPYDNVEGIHAAGAAQADMAVRLKFTQQQRDQIKLKAQAQGMRVANLTDTWILLNLKLTGRPVSVQLWGSGKGHGVVAYQATGTASDVTVSFADPNHPGASRSMVFRNGFLQPLPLQAIATGNPVTMVEATAYGLSSYVTLFHLESNWTDFYNREPGKYRLPRLRQFEVYDSAAVAWSVLGDTVRLAADTLIVKARCQDCPVTDDELGAKYVDAAITAEDGTILATGHEATLRIPEGTHRLFVMAHAKPYAAASFSFLDGKYIVVIRGKLRLFPLTLTGKADTAYTFTASTSGVASAGWKFIWNFGDGTGNQTVTGDSVKTHVFTAGGTFTVTVEVRDPANKLVGKTTTDVTIVVGERWRITSFTARPLTHTVPASTTIVTQLMGSYRITEWTLRDSLLARPGGGIIEVRAANAPALARWYHPNDFTILFDWLMGLQEPNGTAAMYVTFPRGNQVIAGLVGATGFPVFAPGFGFGVPRNPVTWVNTFVKGAGSPVTYKGSGGAKAIGNRTAVGPQPSPVIMALEIDATVTPNGGLAGTLSFVAYISCGEGGMFLPCQVNPIVGEARQTYDFTAVRQ